MCEQTEGLRHDAGKRPWALFFWDAAGVVADVSAMGARKYAERNWERGMLYGRTFSCMQRHAIKWWLGEDDDEESGLPHLAHAAWNALALLTYEIRGMRGRLVTHPVTGENVRMDDRPLQFVRPARETVPSRQANASTVIDEVLNVVDDIDRQQPDFKASFDQAWATLAEHDGEHLDDAEDGLYAPQRFYVHRNWAGAAFVKTAAMFEAQPGGPWKNAWVGVFADGIVDARNKANKMPKSLFGIPPDEE